MPPQQQNEHPQPVVSTAIKVMFQQALAFHNQGQLAQAERLYREIVAQAPAHFDAWHLLGVIAVQTRNSAAAVELFGRAITIDPDNAIAHSNRGTALQDLERYEEALASFDRALALQPDHAEVLNNRGIALCALRRPEEALAAYDRALRVKPDYADALYNRGNALRELKRHEEAVASYDRALSVKPDYAEALNNRGNVLQDLKRHEEALASFERALALDGGNALALFNRGNVLGGLGRVDEAAVSYRKSLSIKPGHPAIHDALIFTVNRMALDSADIFAQARIFAAQFERSVSRLPHRNTPDPERKLKVGYVSGDFREHSAAYLIEPILAHHDGQAVEAYCYSNHSRIDHITRRLMAHADHWRSIVGLSDDQAAARVQEDGIDILVDLSGHTAHNRLLTFARKPAPVQVTWIGLPCTTGLSAMDYRLTNACIDPVGMTERYHSETLVRLSGPNCFQPVAALPPVRELPALSNGCVTFASFNDVAKISPTAYALWSRILGTLPDSRLMMVCNADASKYVQKTLMAHGLGAERLIFVDKVPFADYLALHNRVDIALDTFPYNGGMTTRNCLWMGVPVVSLAGSTPVSRFGLALMSPVGLDAFVANDEEEYVQIALRWSRDLPRLAEVRRTLRARVQEAPMSNALERTRELEAAYRRMWRTWCAGTAQAAR